MLMLMIILILMVMYMLSAHTHAYMHSHTVFALPCASLEIVCLPTHLYTHIHAICFPCALQHAPHANRYTDPNDDTLVLTDLERLERRPYPPPPPLPPPGAGAGAGGAGPAAAAAGSAGAAAAAGSEAAGGGGGGGGGGVLRGTGPLLALRLAFTLPSSCYATMLLRDLMKVREGEGGNALALFVKHAYIYTHTRALNTAS